MMIAWLIQQPGQWQGRKVSAFLAVLIACHGVSVAQQEKITCLHEIKYENLNQVNPDALTVRDLKGQVTDTDGATIPQACLGIFTETERKLIASTTSDEDGNYKFDKIRPGQYRLVVFYKPLCTANAKIVIAATVLNSIRNRPVYIHMRAAGVDSCSYASHTRRKIGNNP